MAGAVEIILGLLIYRLPGTVALHVSLLSLVNGANEGQVTGMITCSGAGDHQAGAGEQSW